MPLYLYQIQLISKVGKHYASLSRHSNLELQDYSSICHDHLMRGVFGHMTETIRVIQVRKNDEYLPIPELLRGHSL